MWGYVVWEGGGGVWNCFATSDFVFILATTLLSKIDSNKFIVKYFRFRFSTTRKYFKSQSQTPFYSFRISTTATKIPTMLTACIR